MKVELEILLPVYNEVEYIGNLLKGINGAIKKKISYRFLICEDGSNDGTKLMLKKLMKKYNIKLITKKERKGFSRAVQDGIKKAKADYLLMMDSDGQCDFKNILKLWKHRKYFDLVNAQRVKRIDYAYRKIFSTACYILYKILFNVPLKDPSFTFIMVNKKVYRSLNNYNVLCPDGFSWEFNARAKMKGYKFKEIQIIHKKRKYGETKIYTYKNLPKIAIRHLLGMLKIKFFNG
tara:strand:+ start:36 stop:737 length:702 start_codon:yes stop_codon:yes gene_type:complete